VFAVGRLDVSLSTHLGIEPNHVLVGNSLVDGLAEGHNVPFSGPDPQTGCQAAQSKGADCQTEKFEGCDANVVEKSIFCRLRWVGCQRELCECLKGLTDDKGHEWSDSTGKKRGEDSGKEQKEAVTWIKLRKEQTN
jgi:hypothetical protein